MRLSRSICTGLVLLWCSGCSDDGPALGDGGTEGTTATGTDAATSPGTTPTATSPTATMPTTADDADDDPDEGPDDGPDDGPNDDTGTDTGTGDGDGTDTTTGGEPTTGVCVASCAGAADCCPLGAIGCPGEDYPNNWECIEGACQLGGCMANADCSDLPIPSDQECLPVAGVGACVDVCENNTDCLFGTTCSGKADDGTMYCAAPVEPCESDDDCGGAGVCDLDTGTCGCTSDDECTTEDQDACSLPR
jgi:hypothetical protein